VTAQPSYRRVAELAGVSYDVVWKAANGGTDHLSPLHRYRLEHVGFIQAADRAPIARAILECCVTEGFTELAQLERRAGLGRNTIARVLKAGSASRATLTALAPVLRSSLADLEALCRPDRRGWPLNVARMQFAKAINEGRAPDIDRIVALAVERNPNVDAARIRADLEARRRKLRGPGASRSYTAAEAREVVRLRDVEGQSWPEIGRRMGWPLKLNASGHAFDCPKARRAYEHARRNG
jgi:hypothetical protein